MKVLQKTKLVVLGLVAVTTLAVGCVVNPVHAECSADCSTGCTGADQTKCYADLASGGNNDSLMTTMSTIINVVLGLIGFVAVAIIVYGGIQYTISSGDAAKVKKAKDTILYGIVGLIIALLAAAIVNFVLVGVFKAGATTDDAAAAGGMIIRGLGL